ncbi:phage terminase large subunit family protein [Brevundimonas sp.]|uniref:phage terminase large subunit family protein n=1 Tax=Brevundimonas sp. TaxID=1871086 RepID=UPI0035B47AF4
MLAVTEPGVEIISAMVATQLLKTSLLENSFGYFAHLDPCPILMVQPKEEAAEQFSKERIGPLIQATPVLRALVGDSRTRRSASTLVYKGFPGGYLALVGAGSPTNLASRPIRLVLYDEVDKYLPLKEGDPITIGDERLATAGTRGLSIRVCSPTYSGESRIERSYEASDQRRASVECPQCAHRQFLDWSSVQWPKTEAPGLPREHQTHKAQIFCQGCGVGWTEAERLGALQTIRWHQTRPFVCCGERQDPREAYARATKECAPDADPVEQVWDWWAADRYAVYRAKCWTCGTWGVDNSHAGFQAGKLYSPWPRDRPAKIAAKWIEAQGDEDLLQTWWNTQQGLPYRRNAGKAVQAEVLAARRETWAEGEVPDGVAILTAGIDTQDDRIEIEVVGWGRDLESWSIDYEVIPGSFRDPHTQHLLDEYLKRRFRRADGRAFTIAAACHDSGGHHTEAVYRFSIDRLARQIWAIKGASDRPGQRSPIWPAKRPTAKNKEKFRPYIIGTQAAKDLVSSQLQVETPGPGYMHYPHDRDIGWFHQITAERIGVKVIGGRKIRFWEPIPGRANEGLDCRVYAYAALAGWMAKGGKLNALVAQIANLPPPEPQPVTDEDDDGSASSAAAPERRRRAAPQRRVVKSSYMTRG